jgi:hypothetical protein
LKNAVQFAAMVFWSAATVDEVDEADGWAAADEDGDGLGAELLPLLPQAATPALATQASRIQEANLRVFTQAFSSFVLSLAM